MKIQSIEHKYEHFKLDIHDLTINSRKIIGLIGENGVGKTTFMSLLAGEMKANEKFIVAEYDKDEVLYIPSDLELYDYLTVEEFVSFVLKYNYCSKSLEEILKLLELENKKNTVIEELSMGMKKKLTLLPIFVREYKLLLLDEPFNSIDLTYIYKLKQLLKEMKKKVTIIVSSHILDTLADLCDEILIMQDGKVSKHIQDCISIKDLEREIFEEHN